MKKYRAGLLVGRFQPFHKGHLYLIRHALKTVDRLVIGIGSANIYDENNPFTLDERKNMVEKVIREEQISDRVNTIVGLNDYYDDNLWYENTIKNIGKIEVVVGNNEWTNNIFNKRGYEIMRVGYYKRYLYEGERIRTLIKTHKQWQNRVPSYLMEIIEKCIRDHAKLQFRFDHAAVAGTFDRFHKGHKKLLDVAFKNGKTVSIGITTEMMYRQKILSEIIEPYETRKRSVTNYCIQQGTPDRTSLFPLSDIYGKSTIDGTIEALIVTKETYQNAIKVNTMRENKKLPQMQLIIVPAVNAEDGKAISSERIRKGEIDREGKIYKPDINKQLIMPESLRTELQKPLNILIEGKETDLENTAKKTTRFINEMKPVMVIAVGDIISLSLERIGFIPDVKIIDFRSRRQEIPVPKTIKFSTLKRVINRPGTISKNSVQIIEKSIRTCLETKQKQTIVINGEEDLLVLPSVLLAPLGTVVLYGQIDMGIVVIEVTEKAKKTIKNIVDKFT